MVNIRSVLTLLVGDAFPGRIQNLRHQSEQNDNVFSDVASRRFMVHQMQHVERLSKQPVSD